MSPARTAVLFVTTLTALASSPAASGGQTLAEATVTPDATARLFLQSVRAIRWNTAAQFIDPEALDRFTLAVTMIVEADRTGDFAAFLVQTDSAGLAELGPDQVFDRAVGAVIDDMPGLMHALYDRDDEVIGSVLEGADRAHAVYRTTARISGAQPEVKVMQLRRGTAGWRVLWSDELEVLEAALRGVVR